MEVAAVAGIITVMKTRDTPVPKIVVRHPIAVMAHVMEASRLRVVVGIAERVETTFVTVVKRRGVAPRIAIFRRVSELIRSVIVETKFSAIARRLIGNIIIGTEPVLLKSIKRRPI